MKTYGNIILLIVFSICAYAALSCNQQTELFETSNTIQTKQIKNLDSTVYVHAKLLHVSVSDLYRKIHKESGWRLDAVSPDRGASGLWQARKSTRKELGLNKPLKNYNLEEQMAFHLHYCALKGWFNMYQKFDILERGFRLWLLGFLPSYVNKSEDFIIPSRYYRVNKGLDQNKDGKITILEMKMWYYKN